MARRGYDEYDRDIRRGRDPRELQREREREQDPRERLDRRDHRRTETQDPDRMDYTREGRLDPPMNRDPTSRMVYPYTDPNDRDDPPSRGYMHDAQDRYRQQPIDLQPERREEPSRYQEYFLPGESINREVIQYDICRYLGNDATVRPYTHPDVGCRLFPGSNSHAQADHYQGRQGFLIKAYRPPTTVCSIT
jgi:hypothetical protein